jgi:hypothetical protein
MSERQRCGQPTAKGTPCQLPVADGTDRCWTHLSTSPVGRPSLLTDEVAEMLVTMLRSGNYVHVAIRAAGIASQTFGLWMKRGLSEKPKDAPYRELRQRVERARAEGQVRHVALIARAADEDWRAASWLLERQYPELWGGVSVRIRTEAEPPVAAEEQAEFDPFAEVDELAERRRTRSG